MRWQRISVPEPVLVPVAELRDWLHLNHNDDDARLVMLERTARHYMEDSLQVSLLNQTWQIELDVAKDKQSLARLEWNFAFGPVQNLVAASWWDLNGVETPLSLEQVSLQADMRQAHVSLLSPGSQVSKVRLQILAGYGDLADQVPPALVQAVQLLAAHLYENPFSSTLLEEARLPAAVRMVLAPYRRMAL